jgi:hypothetical protein
LPGLPLLVEVEVPPKLDELLDTLPLDDEELELEDELELELDEELELEVDTLPLDELVVDTLPDEVELELPPVELVEET